MRFLQPLIGVLFIVIGGVVLYFSPVTRYACTRGSPTDVHCRLQRQLLGVLPLEDRTVADVRSASYDVDVRTSTTPVDPRDPYRAKPSAPYFNILLTNGRGERVYAGETSFVVGERSQDIAERINDLIRDPKAHSMSAWQGQWFPNVAGLLFLLFGLLALYPLLVPRRGSGS